ncbi:MAG TPA: hypothetical protein VFI19_16655 [Nocardioides sp.]|nr:hypothetical protein [Nocardioides sp.]
MPTFVIRVEGELSDHLMTWFPSLAAQAQDGHTVLCGDLPDQSSLLGVLAALDMMGARIQMAGLAAVLDHVPTPS